MNQQRRDLTQEAVLHANAWMERAVDAERRAEEMARALEELRRLLRTYHKALRAAHARVAELQALEEARRG